MVLKRFPQTLSLEGREVKVIRKRVKMVSFRPGKVAVEDLERAIALLCRLGIARLGRCQEALTGFGTYACSSYVLGIPCVNDLLALFCCRML